jgi:hypothetical protein
MGLQPDEVDKSVVAKSLDGSSRLSFVDELDTLEVSKSELQNGNNDNGNNDDSDDADHDGDENIDDEEELVDQIDGDFPKETQDWMATRRGQRDASHHVMLTEDEVDRIFDDVFAIPDENGRQVTLNEIALTRAIMRHEQSGDMPFLGKRRNFPWIKYQREMLACLVLVLIGITAWAAGRVQSNMENDYYNKNNNSNNDNDDTMATATTHVVTMVSEDSDPAKSVLVAQKLNRTAQRPPTYIDLPMQDIIPRSNETSDSEGAVRHPLRTKEMVLEPNAVPGKDIGEFLIGFVKQPLRAEAVQLLLNHDLTKSLRVRCEDASLDASEAISVTVDSYELWCGIKIDQVPLTAICVPDDLCGIYFVDASYCDTYE